MKKYAIITSLILLVALWFYSGQTEQLTQELDITEVDLINPSAASSVISSHSASSVTSSHPAIQPKTISSDTVIEHSPGYKEWRQSRGYFSDEDLQEYGGFKLDKLEELASKGDLKAIEVLRKYELSSGNTKRYNELVNLAAVYGSLSSVRILTADKMGEYVISKKEEDILEMFAYANLAVKRGDLNTKYGLLEVYSKSFNFYPNEEQQKYIDQRSDELMVDLEKRREELGLPPFDNSPLESDRLKYEFMNEEEVDN